MCWEVTFVPSGLVPGVEPETHQNEDPTGDHFSRKTAQDRKDKVDDYFHEIVRTDAVLEEAIRRQTIRERCVTPRVLAL